MDPLVKIYVWHCPDKKCEHVNETLASEEGRVRVLPSGNELREPMWYTEKCKICHEVAGRRCCLLEVKLVPPVDVVKDKGKAKAPADEDVEMDG
jgi:hypothetical protein